MFEEKKIKTNTSEGDNPSSMRAISSQCSGDTEKGSETRDAATCLCGCGEAINPKRNRKYIWGHHAKHIPMRGGKNGMFGKAPWNKGLTKATDSRVKKNAEGVSRTRNMMVLAGEIIVHNKGKSKSDYEPLQIVSMKLSGSQNPMAGKSAWNNGLTKYVNPDRVTYGIPKEKHWNWRGGISLSYGYSWKFIREEIKKRDNYTCAICGSKSNLVVHHKIAYRAVRNHKDFSNFITLCRKCHGRVEASIRLMKQVDDIVRPTQRCVEAVRNDCPLSSARIVSNLCSEMK